MASRAKTNPKGLQEGLQEFAMQHLLCRFKEEFAFTLSSQYTYFMANLSINISTPHKEQSRRTLRVEINADRLEQLAASFGLFSDEFLESVHRAEKDVRKGKIKKISSLADLSPKKSRRK